MRNNKKTGMPTRNDKMTTNDNMVLKRHARNTRSTRLDMKAFFSSNRGHRDVEG